MKQIIIGLCICFILSACGQAGRLYLPQQNKDLHVTTTTIL